MTVAIEEPTTTAHSRGAAPTVERGGRADAIALGVLAVLTAIVAWNRLAFDAWLTRLDLLTFFLPWYTFLGDRLRDLAVPGWNPHLFGGAPFAGDPESGWMYLPAMLFFSALAPATAAFKGMVAFQLAIAALSTYLFARVLGMGAMASLVAATVYLVGPFLQWNTNCCLIFSQFATWIPLALLGVELALAARGWRGRVVPWFLGGFAVSQMFAGWIGEGWLYAVLLPAGYAAYRIFFPSPRSVAPLPARLRAGAATAAATVGLGLALAAAGMLPRFAINAETNLAGGDYSRLPGGGVLNPPWTLDYLLLQTFGAGSGYHFRAASFGGAAVVLALLAVPLAGRRFAAPFFAALTVVAMLLTLDETPLHHLFYLIPRWREFHEHDAWRTISLAAIGPALLSGAAIESLPGWRGRRRLLPLVVLPLVLMAVMATTVWRPQTFLGWQPLVAAALTTGLIAVVVAGPGGRAHLAPGRVGAIVPALVLAVAVLFPTGLELTGSWLGWPEQDIWEGQWRPDPALEGALATEVSRTDPGGAGAFLQEQLAISGPFRYVGYAGFGFAGDEARRGAYMGRSLDPAVQAVLVNGRPIFLGLYDIQGYNPLQLSRSVEFMTALNGAPQDYHTAFVAPSGGRSPLLDLLDVRYLLIDAALPPEREDVVALTAGHREVFRTPRVIVYERAPAPPHAWIVHDVRRVARGEALPLLTSGAVDPYRTALVEGTPPETGAADGSAPESARVVAYEPDRLRIATEADAPGLLVVSEIYESGWRAFVDGASVAVLPTDHALRGILLPAGEHTVELRYEPWSLRVGLPISGVAVVAMLAAVAVAGWGRLAGMRRRRG